jgi:uncharacterized phage protein gp47/JayE
MPSLAELTTPLTVEQATQVMLDRLAGRGRVIHDGTGAGELSISGAPNAAHDIVVTVASDGGNSVSLSWTIDGTAGGPATFAKSSAPAALGSSGISIALDSGTFAADDTYSFSVAPAVLPTTAWQPGSVPLSLLASEADPLADLSRLIAKIAASGLLETAAGDWLTLLAWNVYGLRKNPATATLGFVRLTNSSTSPQSIAVGQLWLSDAVGHRFTNTLDGTLAASGTLDLPVQAEQLGAGYNVAQGTIVAMVTPLPGVSVTNQVDWLTRSGAVPGTDEESDDLLRQRCRARWSALGIGATVATYRLWARTAEPAVQQVAVIQDVAVPGQVDVYIAGAAGAELSGAIVASVDAYIRPRMPACAGLFVASATAHAISVVGTVYVSTAKMAAAKAAIEAALTGYFNNAPIGGYSTPLAPNVISAEKIVGLITSPDGVIDALVTSPAANVTLGATEVPQPTYSLTYVAVP